ncbi:MAG: hypothetical protein JKX82_02910 [Oleispira sp.]|nr:hypothetical protein [Oleispira sp.]
MTTTEKEKLDHAAIDLEKLADQIIITSPAKDSVVDQSIVIVRADIPADALAQEVALYVDGIEVARDTDGAPWEIQWPAYYSADDNKHTLLLKTITGSGNEVRNNEQFQLTVSATANQALAFSAGLNGTEIQDKNQLEVSFTAFPTATRYEVSIGDQIVETTNTSTILENLEVGIQTLRYRAIFDYSSTTTLIGPWSAPAQIEVLPPLLPTIHEPTVEKKETGYDITFAWDVVTGGDTYTIFIGNSADSLEEAGTTSEGNYALEGIELGEYQWQLKRHTTLGQFSASDIKQLNVGVFKTQLGGSRDDRASQIINSKSGGYIVRANTSSYEVTATLQGDSDDWIIRLDEQGNVTNQYIENKGGRERYRSMIEASDGSIYLVGLDWDTSKALIVKLDANLEAVWDSEILYRPESVSERYEFIAVAEWNNKLYVSAAEWGRNGSSTFRDKAHLHEVNMDTGTVSPSITLPSMSGVKIESIKAIIPKADGNLVLVGSGEPYPKPEYSMGGAFVITLDSDLNEVSSWESVGDYHLINVGNTIELSSGRMAVIGQSEGGGFAISAVNANGTEHRYYTDYIESIYYGGITNLVQMDNGTLLSFLQKYEGSSSYTYLLKGFNDNLIPVSTNYLDDITGSVTPYGMVIDTDDSITLLYGQGQNGYNNYDIVIRRIAPISN